MTSFAASGSLVTELSGNSSGWPDCRTSCGDAGSVSGAELFVTQRIDFLHGSPEIHAKGPDVYFEEHQQRLADLQSKHDHVKAALAALQG